MGNELEIEYKNKQIKIPEKRYTFPQLKPCPFCGGDAQIEGAGKANAHIKCLLCGAETECYNGIDRAITAWNRRT